MAFSEGVTLRAIGIGLGASILISAWTTYAKTGVNTSTVNLTALPISLLAVFILFALASFAMKARGVRGLTRAELLTAMAMGLVSASLPLRGLTGIWLGMITLPYYKATPENGWVEYVHPYLQSHLYPTNDGYQMTFFYEGLPAGASIPWSVWLSPMFWWCSLIIAGFGVCLCTSVILRRQWSRHERLDYPLLSPMLEMIEETDGPTGEFRWPSLLRGRYFWIGFGIGFGIIAWNIVGYFDSGWPRISMSPNGGIFRFHKMFPPLLTHVNTYTIGFGYFVKLEILFSIWFFHLLLMIESGFLSRIGFQLGGIRVKGGGWNAVTTYQGLGAYFLYVLWGLWAARSHLRAVCRKAFQRDEKVDDSDEMLSYRAAVFGLLLGLVYVAGWLYRTGVQAHWIVLVLPIMLVMYVGLARFVCEAGTLYLLYLPASPWSFPSLIFGTRGLPASAATGNTTSSVLEWGKFMPILSQGAKATDRIEGNRRSMPYGLYSSLVVGLAVNILLIIYLGYTYGAFNFSDWTFKSYAVGRLHGIVGTLKSPKPPEWEWLAIFCWGGLVMSGLMALRYRFPLFPIHPIGFIVTTTPLLHEITSIFIVWAYKFITLRIGGAMLFNRYRPLFFGLIVGRGMGVLLSFLIDLVFFHGGGHGVHGWA